MAFQMIHMEIAYRLLNRIPQISNAAEFILGSVAPDSVHMNPDYNIDMKVKSHLFEDCGKWSDTQDYQRWKRNIHHFCEMIAGKEDAYRDFCIGICVHCLTDYWNDLKICTHFFLRKSVVLIQKRRPRTGPPVAISKN